MPLTGKASQGEVLVVGEVVAHHRPAQEGYLGRRPEPPVAANSRPVAGDRGPRAQPPNRLHTAAVSIADEHVDPSSLTVDAGGQVARSVN